jgi:hypothetical protein
MGKKKKQRRRATAQQPSDRTPIAIGEGDLSVAQVVLSTSPWSWLRPAPGVASKQQAEAGPSTQDSPPPNMTGPQSGTSRKKRGRASRRPGATARGTFVNLDWWRESGE